MPAAPARLRIHGFTPHTLHMALKEVSVEELHFGMYVSQLDRPWTETPFMFQGFVLKTEQQLDTLKKFCKKVYVDPEKVELPDPVRSAAPARTQRTTGAGENVRGNVTYREAASVEQELPKARAVFAQTGDIVASISRAVLAGEVLEGARAKEAVTQITDSVVRNPDAMMLLIKMREKGGQVASRALQVSVYMTVFGRFLQLPRERIEVLGLMGLLQDVGALKLPTGLADRRGELNGAERELYKTHITLSVETLSKTQGLPADLPGLASLHHERFDGSGYPRGLKGNAIPMVGSIAAIVDTFDALTSPPPYGDRMSPSTALNVLFQNRGTQFHAALVEQFIQCVGVFPVGSVVEMNNGEIAVVIAQNMVRRLQPRVMVVQDANGNPLNPHKMLDLAKDPKVSRDEPYRIRRTLEGDRVQVDPRELFL
ncbi:MAG: HD-GYP domain-containing protein [Burkholderiales bacterium]